MSSPEYKLSTVLIGHAMDVRCVATTAENCILSASRDRTAKLWHPEGVKDFVNVVTYKGHKNFVSCVCWLPPCESFPEGLVITGSNDNTILGYNLQDGSVQLTMEGHENAVCSVSPGRNSGILLSSSWDSSAKVWNVNSPRTAILTIKGHQAAVWAVVELGNGTYATGSADKTIMIWRKDGTIITTLTGHTDCVRGLAVSSADTFLSCANDATVRRWTNAGACVNTYYGHSNYIYSITASRTSPIFATGGEGGALRVWTEGAEADLKLPATSVWTVVCLDNGDVVTGSSDGLVRVFTADPARYADEQTLQAFDEEVVKLQAAEEQEIGGFKLSELPGPEALQKPGKSEGATLLIRRGAGVKCYSWSGANGWTEVGEVLGAKPAGEGKTMYQGQEYDFVFSVDTEEGSPPLKLPFNKTEDPWVAAQAFIHKHNLPQVYLEQIHKFIITNAKLDTVPAPSNGFADPFTGEGRYVPGSGGVVGAGKAGVGVGVGATGAPDPFTGGGAYVSAAAKGGRPLIPHDTYIRFDQANLKAIHEKLKEFNSKVGDGLNPMTDTQLENIVKLGELNSSYDPETVVLLKKMLDWPKEIIFPVLDITRLAVRNKEINGQIFDTTHGPLFLQFLVSLLGPDNLPANQLLALRVLVNAFSELPGEMLVLAHWEGVLSALAEASVAKLTKNAQIASASLLVNLSVSLGPALGAGASLAVAICRLLPALTDTEAYLRGLVALGTVLAEYPNKLEIQSEIVSNVHIHNRLKKDSSTLSTDINQQKVINCSQQIIQLL